MKYTKHPVRTKYLYKSETNGSVYTVITKSSKIQKTEQHTDNLSKSSPYENKSKGIRLCKPVLFDDISNRELWTSKLKIQKYLK